MLIEWSLYTHSEHWQHFQSVFLSLPVGQIEHLPCHLPPPFFTVVGDAGCLQATPFALVALQICLSPFPLSALLMCGFTISSPRQSIYRHLRFFFSCCQMHLHKQHQSSCGIVSKANALLILYKCIPSQACPECQRHC